MVIIAWLQFLSALLSILVSFSLVLVLKPTLFLFVKSSDKFVAYMSNQTNTKQWQYKEWTKMVVYVVYLLGGLYISFGCSFGYFSAVRYDC